MSEALRIADEPTVRIEYPAPHRWSAEEYHRLATEGFFGRQRVELIEGTVIDMSPMGRPHWIACQAAADTLRAAFGAGYFVTTNLPAYLSDFSEPEPDVAVLAGEPRDYAQGQSTAPLLVIEVSESSLEYDRTSKCELYARYAIPDYWIINLPERTIEVYREPAPDPSARFGYRYTSSSSHHTDDFLSPLALPGRRISVAHLLP